MVRDETLNTACPDAFSVPVPMLVLPSKNVTVPVGTPPAPETVAVKVTVCPQRRGISDEARVVVVAARFTVCVSAADVLDPKLALPLYTAVMLWLPTMSDDIVKLA